MIRRSLPYALAIACVSAAWPSVAAEEEVANGIVGTGLGMFALAIAGALLATLLIRITANHYSQTIADNLNKQRFNRIVTHHSKHVLQDFILPGAYGGLTRIDCAVLTASGLLCIQIKNYNGTISGKAKEPQWTIADGGQQRNFLNPLIQSEGRAKALQNIVPNVPVANLVVFTGTNSFAAKPADNAVHIRDLAVYIEGYNSNSCDIADPDAIWQTIKAAALTDEESRKDFAAQLSFS